MVDCNFVDNDEEGSGSNDQDTTEDGCARYVVWAAVSIFGYHRSTHLYLDIYPVRRLVYVCGCGYQIDSNNFL